jgi:glycosyltransferase involved in cell wall biosynthesis/peptidoglycan/xylan/chitin deacetylase (PgdA/CDA1 family)
MSSFIQNTYYFIKPLVPRWMQIQLRRSIVLRKRLKYAQTWPIDERAKNPPEGWSGWPSNKQFALVLTHDVETAKGLEKCYPLAELEKSLGFRSSFNFVAEDYTIPTGLQDNLTVNGFEIGLHGLSHRESLFKSEEIFQKQVTRVNHYLKEWGCVGFRAPSMYHNLELAHNLNILYDSSTFDTDPFEPQSDGMRTIFPFWVAGNSNQKGYVELPYTLPQDFTLFVIMKERNIDIWKRKLDWVAEHGGMVLLITHPDYMCFDKRRPGVEEYPSAYYREFLEYVSRKYEGQYWHALPKDITEFFKRDVVNQGQGEVTTLNREDVQERRQLRACMVVYSFYEYDNRVIRYAETLVKRGDNVDVIAIGKKGQPRHEVIRGVNVYRVQNRTVDEKGRLPYLIKLLAFLLNSAVFLTQRHMRNPYDLIHIHSVPDFEVFAAFFAKLKGAKIILDIHDIVPEFYASKFNKSKDSFLFRMLSGVEKASSAFSHHVIISNHIWEKLLLSRSVDESKCTVIMNYPDNSIFHRRPRTRNDGKFIMIYPGSYNWHQGLDIAIKALALIKDKAPEVEFHIYGRGSERENLEKLVDQVGLHEQVFFKDTLPMDQIAEVMSNADLGVVPKRNDLFGGEAFSTKILEFMSVGIPVIVSRTRIDNYYFNESSVRFFDPEDEQDLARCMLELIQNPDSRMRLAEIASEFVESYIWENNKDVYLQLVDRLTNN